jgi:hypothetical protein
MYSKTLQINRLFDYLVFHKHEFLSGLILGWLAVISLKELMLFNLFSCFTHHFRQET